MIHAVKIRDMEALANYQKELMYSPKLRYIFFEMTDQCNLKCIHCGSNCDSLKRHILPLPVIQKVLTSIARECNPQDIMVCLTGGEPVLHPELVKVIAIAHSMGFPVGITTSGTLIDDHMAERLYRCGLDTVAILVVKLGASTGQVAIVDTDKKYNIWVPLAAIRCNDQVDSRFIFYCFQSDYLIRQMELSWTFGTQQTLGVKTIEQLKFFIPSLDEQKSIVDYIEYRSTEIDSIIRKKTELLSELEGYKKSLIYEYVTGKKEVPA